VEQIILEKDSIEQICAESWDLSIHERIVFYKWLNSLFPEPSYESDSSSSIAVERLLLECLEVTWGEGSEVLIIEGVLAGWIVAVEEGRIVRGRAVGFLEGMEEYLAGLVAYYDALGWANERPHKSSIR
jgi:hypothetical protein